jgi:hypothetical protein
LPAHEAFCEVCTASFGQIPTHQQSELIREIAWRPADDASDALADLLAAADQMKAVRPLGFGGSRERG